MKILNKETNYGKRMIKEAIDLEKCQDNFNREDGWKLSNAWKPIIHQELKEEEKLSKERKQPTNMNTQHKTIVPTNTNQIGQYINEPKQKCRCWKIRTSCMECKQNGKETSHQIAL